MNNDNINTLMVEICKCNGFNWLSQSRGYDINRNQYRRLCEELLYAIETIAQGSYKEIINEVLDNVPEWWIDEVENN